MNIKKNFEVGKIKIEYSFDEKSPNNLNNRHCHNQYEILYVLDGSGKYIVEGTEYPIRPRTLMLFPPLAYHCVHLDENMPYERYVVHFSKEDLTKETASFLSALFDKSISGVAEFYAADAISATISALFERYENIDKLPEREKAEYVRLITSELVLLLSVANMERIPRDEIDLGARIIKYLNEHIDKDISLDILAKKFFVSKYYLCRAFKKHNGISVHGYINQKRVMYAKQLIESGETASSAAYRVGFGDYSAFYRAYVKILGKSPTCQDF